MLACSVIFCFTLNIPKCIVTKLNIVAVNLHVLFQGHKKQDAKPIYAYFYVIRHGLAHHKILKDRNDTLSPPPTHSNHSTLKYHWVSTQWSLRVCYDIRTKETKLKCMWIPYLSQFLPVVKPPQLKHEPVSGSQSSANPLQRQGRQLGNPK